MNEHIADRWEGEKREPGQEEDSSEGSDYSDTTNVVTMQYQIFRNVFSSALLSILDMILYP